ncbi:MAG: hypothetical protein ACOX47_01480 [Bacillota bacterium]
MQFIIEAGKGKYKVHLNVILTMDGINVLLTGGDKTHVGGVVLVTPRKSLTGSGTSCDTWVITVPGHKDVVVAEQVGNILCRKTKEVVAVTAGIHIDNALPDDLKIIMDNCLEGAKKAADECLRLRTKR